MYGRPDRRQTTTWAWEEHLGVVAESQGGDLLGVAEPVLLGARVQVLHYHQAAAGVGKEACSREGAPELVCCGPVILPAGSGLGAGRAVSVVPTCVWPPDHVGPPIPVVAHNSLQV